MIDVALSALGDPLPNIGPPKGRVFQLLLRVTGWMRLRISSVPQLLWSNAAPSIADAGLGDEIRIEAANVDADATSSLQSLDQLSPRLCREALIGSLSYIGKGLGNTLSDSQFRRYPPQIATQGSVNLRV